MTADFLMHKESVMSRCWSRSRSPAGFHVLFSRLESFHITASTRASWRLHCLSLLSCISYRNFHNVHPILLSPKCAIEVDRSVVNCQISASATSLTEWPVPNMDIDKLFKVRWTPAYSEEALNQVHRSQNFPLAATSVGCLTRLPQT